MRFREFRAFRVVKTYRRAIQRFGVTIVQRRTRVPRLSVLQDTSVFQGVGQRFRARVVITVLLLVAPTSPAAQCAEVVSIALTVLWSLFIVLKVHIVDPVLRLRESVMEAFIVQPSLNLSSHVQLGRTARAATSSRPFVRQARSVQSGQQRRACVRLARMLTRT